MLTVLSRLLLLLAMLVLVVAVLEGGGSKKGQAAEEPGVWITNSLTYKMNVLFPYQSVSV